MVLVSLSLPEANQMPRQRRTALCFQFGISFQVGKKEEGKKLFSRMLFVVKVNNCSEKKNLGRFSMEYLRLASD